MPQWLDNAVFYEIYPQSFLDTNADGIGDIQGIIKKLSYIKELGCNAIWINPCFKSPFLDAGYDVSDYYSCAPRYGSNEDLKELFDKAHSMDMHVILDLVPGHTSVEHEWFKKSCQAEVNEYTDRYVWTDSIWEHPEGMSCLSGISSRDGCCGVNFFSHQPALNYGFYNITRPWQQPTDAEGPKATLEEMMNVMRFWLGLGCDGFRVDMAGSLVKNDPESKGTIALWQKVRAFLDAEYPNAAIISEWGEPDKSLLGGFHMDFVLHFGPSKYWELFRGENPYFSSRGTGDISGFVKRYLECCERTNNRGLICIPSGNHDMDRISRNLSADELKIAFAFILSMPGAPFIYYGDEIGMRNVDGLVSVEGGYGRVCARTPMQWDTSVNCGFSSAPKSSLYLSQDESADRPTVSEQQSDETSLYNEVKKLIRVRNSTQSLQSNSSIRFIYAEQNSYPLSYIRGEDILVVINPSDKPCEFECDVVPDEAIYEIGSGIKYSDGVVSCSARSCGFYKIKK